MINNLDIIKSLLNFENEGDFYMLYILQRKKDQLEKENHQSVRTIKTYSIESVEYLDKRWQEIKMLCEIFQARAYIHVQKQNHLDVSLELMVALAERIKNKQHNQRNLFDSVVGKIKTYEKRWIVDIDCKDEKEVNQIIAYINQDCRPYEDKVIASIPTKNGYHLITHRFDVMKFKQKYPNVDLQKKNPTLLYLPDSLS